MHSSTLSRRAQATHFQQAVLMRIYISHVIIVDMCRLERTMAPSSQGK